MCGVYTAAYWGGRLIQLVWGTEPFYPYGPRAAAAVVGFEAGLLDTVSAETWERNARSLGEP